MGFPPASVGGFYWGYDWLSGMISPLRFYGEIVRIEVC